jgi:hypothetical protein
MENQNSAALNGDNDMGIDYINAVSPVAFGEYLLTETTAVTVAVACGCLCLDAASPSCCENDYSSLYWHLRKRDVHRRG